MTIITLAELAERPRGVVFWWSNILRGYQLRVYLEGTPREAEVRLTRVDAESAAQALAERHGLDIYEIDIPRLKEIPPLGDAESEEAEYETV